METLDIVITILLIGWALGIWLVIVSIDKRVAEILQMIYRMSTELDNIRREVNRATGK